MLVQEIEQVIDVKFDLAKDRLATKEDLIGETDSLAICIEQGFKDQLKWLIILMMGFSSLIIALIKLT